jgi:hypothetical protein
VMVASRLLRKGLYPAGLWRSLRPASVLSPSDNPGLNG